MSKLCKIAAGSVIATTAALGGASVAVADGYTPAKVAYERPADWSGVYFGVGSGYQWSTVDVDNVLRNPNHFGISSDHDEAFVSAHIGVQQQWGALVLGIEAGWMSTIRDRDGSSQTCFDNKPFAALNPVGTLTASCTGKLDDILTIGGRAGWSLGHWMPYITGGYANAGLDFATRTRALDGPGNFGASDVQEQAHTRVGGWYIGTGFEWTISPGWTTGLEYRHYEFDTRNATASSGCTSANIPDCRSAPFGTFLENVKFSDTTDTIEARVSWRWGREPAAAPLK
jgi:outer membrane immunogenic protein